MAAFAARHVRNLLRKTFLSGWTEAYAMAKGPMMNPMNKVSPTSFLDPFNRSNHHYTHMMVHFEVDKLCLLT